MSFNQSSISRIDLHSGTIDCNAFMEDKDSGFRKKNGGRLTGYAARCGDDYGNGAGSGEYHGCGDDSGWTGDGIGYGEASAPALSPEFISSKGKSHALF